MTRSARCSFTSRLGRSLVLWPNTGLPTSPSACAFLVVATFSRAASAETSDTMPPILRQRSPPIAEDSSPYPMTYSDELARRLGIKQGRMDMFSISPDTEKFLAPTLKGQIDRNGVGVRLQWETSR